MDPFDHAFFAIVNPDPVTSSAYGGHNHNQNLRDATPIHPALSDLLICLQVARFQAAKSKV
ncbi:hypothetical protein HYPBUDRAFT_153060, partial [Hyphopichia burtonii NRRL Y-1933]